MAELQYVCLYTEYLPMLSEYSDEQFGRLVRAMINYSINGEAPAFESEERFAWPWLKAKIDRDAASYSKRCADNQANGAKGGRPRKTEKPKALDDDAKKPSGFSEGENKPNGFSENPKNPTETETETETITKTITINNPPNPPSPPAGGTETPRESQPGVSISVLRDTFGTVYRAFTGPKPFAEEAKEKAYQAFVKICCADGADWQNTAIDIKTAALNLFMYGKKVDHDLKSWIESGCWRGVNG